MDNGIVRWVVFAYTVCMNGFQSNTLVALLAVVFVVGGSAYLVTQKQQRASSAQDPRAQVRQLMATVGTLVTLPNEEPRITIVTNTQELRKQSYFADVAEGDRVLVFNRSRKAIIYNPTEHKIVKVMDLQDAPSISPNK